LGVPAGLLLDVENAVAQTLSVDISSLFSVDAYPADPEAPRFFGFSFSRILTGFSAPQLFCARFHFGI
jgi:hypothetical protein